MALKLVEKSNIITVEPMNEEQALALIEIKLGKQGDKTDIAKLATALEFMPLAIVQAAAYIKERAPRCSVRQYIEKFEKGDKAKTSLLNHDGGQLRRDWQAKNSIIITWQISFDYIFQTRRSAADLLAGDDAEQFGVERALIQQEAQPPGAALLGSVVRGHSVHALSMRVAALQRRHLREPPGKKAGNLHRQPQP